MQGIMQGIMAETFAPAALIIAEFDRNRCPSTHANRLIDLRSVIGKSVSGDESRRRD